MPLFTLPSMEGYYRQKFLRLTYIAIILAYILILVDDISIILAYILILLDDISIILAYILIFLVNICIIIVCNRIILDYVLVFPLLCTV